jgi:hypothetical protein
MGGSRGHARGVRRRTLTQTDVYDGGHMPQVGKLGNGTGVLKAVTTLEEGQCENKVVTVV